MMELYYGALAVSVLLNGVLAYVALKGSSVSAVASLAEFKAAVAKVKAAKDRASVDAVAYSTAIPQILEVLQLK